MKYYFLTSLNSFIATPIWAKISVVLIAVLSPYATMMHLLVMFWVVDLLTGIMHSTKKRFIEEKPEGFIIKLKMFWRNFESRKLRWSVEKIGCYLTVIVLIAFFEKYFLPFEIGGYTLTKVLSGFFVLIELKSIFENMALLTNSDIFTKVFSIFSKKFKDKTGMEI